MISAFIFPGQGSQFKGMGKDIYAQSTMAKDLFEKANEILGYRLTDIMFEGTDEELKQTKVTQPAIFLLSVVIASHAGEKFKPDMAAGHSLGEFSALTATGALSFENGLLLVYKRALAMQKACEKNPSAMAAIIGLDDEKVEEVCASIKNDIVVAANYNSPGQVVISGTITGVNAAIKLLKATGAKLALLLPVGGAFHSPLMEPARIELAAAIESTPFNVPGCPIYQNVNAYPETEPEKIKKNLILQLTSPVKWTQTIRKMKEDGAVRFYEAGPGKVLQGLIKKIIPDAEALSI